MFSQTLRIKVENGFLLKIEDKYFHWQDVAVKEDGEWLVNFDLYAERV